MKKTERWKIWLFGGILFAVAMAVNTFYDYQQRREFFNPRSATSNSPAPERTVEARREVAAIPTKTPEELAAERARFIAQYVKEGIGRTPSATTVFVAVADANGKLSGTLTTFLANQVASSSVRTHPSAFNPSFLADGFLAEAFHDAASVTVLDFTDLQGGGSELGKYIAEELTVNLVMNKKDFSILDRANLKSILQEHKLTATGLVDPENAKKLGQFAGVDTLIIGTIVPMNNNVQLTAKLITTDTAEIIGAAKAFIRTNNSVQHLFSAPANTSRVGDTAQEPTKVTKTFGNLRVDMKSLSIVNGKQLQLSVELVNLNAKKSIWVAVSTDSVGNVKGVATDSNYREFQSDSRVVSGVEWAYPQNGGIFRATEIKPNDSLSATVKFFSRPGDLPSPGMCQVQLELLVANSFSGNFASATAHSLSARIEAN